MITSIELKTFTKEQGHYCSFTEYSNSCFLIDTGTPHPHLTAFQLIVKSDKAKAGVIIDSASFETSDASKLLAAFDHMKKAVEDELNSGRL
jgi:hypothetical protein